MRCPVCKTETDNEICPVCGAKVTFGRPILPEDVSYITIHGYTESFTDTNVQIYDGNRLLLTLGRGKEKSIPIERDCELRFVSGLHSSKVRIVKDVDTHIVISLSAIGKINLKKTNSIDIDNELRKAHLESQKHSRMHTIIVIIVIIIVLLYNFL